MIFSYDSATYFINKNWLVGYYLGFLTFLMGLYFRGGQNRERGTASRKALYLAFMKCMLTGTVQRVVPEIGEKGRPSLLMTLGYRA